MKRNPSNNSILISLVSFLITFFSSSTLAATFCDDVLDSYDFEAGVFAGPDPDHLPTVINGYVAGRVRHEVLKGELTRDQARFFMETAIGEMRLFESIAEHCRRNPKSGIRLIDRLIEPQLKADSVDRDQIDRANRTAENFLPILFEACQNFWMESGTFNSCPQSAVQDNPEAGLEAKEGLSVDIIDGTMTGFEARARHREGDTTYRVTAEGTVTEYLEE